MNKIEKLFQKISAHDRKVLLLAIKELISNPRVVGVKKLVGSDFYRYRKGNFRIIFHIENKNVIIDNVSLRNEKTYRDF